MRDSGIGIGPQTRTRLFQAFAQADGSTTRRYGGTGLGLAISHNLVQLMGGTMGVESEPNEGSTFWFTLPLRCRRACRRCRHPGSARAPPRARRGRQRDEPRDPRAARARRRHESACAANGLRRAEAAASVAQRQGNPFDIADRRHEDAGHGRPRARRGGARRSAARATCGSCSCPRCTRRTSWRRARELGVSAYLSKPVKRQELFRALAQTLGEAVAEDAASGGGQRAARRHSSARVLLAEDNGVNQVVARNMLKALGCEPEIVRNGARGAARRAARAPTTSLLMDCQMPVMDGYAATQRGRASGSSESGTRSACRSSR